MQQLEMNHAMLSAYLDNPAALQWRIWKEGDTKKWRAAVALDGVEFKSGDACYKLGEAVRSAALKAIDRAAPILRAK